ncbi:MAG: glutathione peroxidase [Rhodospirillaceae bacterium]|nr:glutathione peroxidase [Rhodospirillaceae bacterium]MBT5239799.1 glutathione peroxidase [Rhodospirillaceae bacterium]MBT5567185.1 glutathione peroxidase [Rhodospirillaceae bacterium]MBT6089398.1 glutathione peroxidase [Rhodospirillaceae bacterium]MBT6962124.1 glutathione peroxidase [Rhodospirillaceae bacterium]
MNRRTLTATLIASIFLLSGGNAAMAETAHDFSFDSIDGGALPMSQYKGKALLVVNTASFCGYTPQYEGLQSLWSEYKDKGLVVLGVPSNDFGAQEPGTAEEIKDFCEANFDVDFPLTAKEVVKGGSAHSFYKWAAAEKGAENAPSWNFHKYLVAPDGSLVEAFPSRVEPMSKELVSAIEAQLP